MKKSPEIIKAESNMEAGVISAEGFLGDDKRDLASVLEEDALLLSVNSLEIKDIAQKLEYLMEEGRKGLGEPVTVDGKWLVRTDEARGVIACPWEDGVFKKINVTVERTDIKKSISYTDLSIHMLKEHGFLEGRGAPFRLEPSVLAEVLY